MEQIKKLRYRSVQNSVYTSLRKNIMNLNLAPGTGISEKEISLRYQVSRTPVRETFIHLAKEGLVRVIPQKETLVSLIDFSRVEQERFLRTNLEIAVLEPFVKKCPPERFADLEELIALQRSAFEHNASVEFMNYDDEFHRTFFEVAGQELSWEVLESMSGHYYRVRLLTIRLKGIVKDIISQHQELFIALKGKNVDKARESLSLHLHKLNTEEKMLREEFPAYFVSKEPKDNFDVDFKDVIFTQKHR